MSQNEKAPRLTIQIIAWNTMKFLPGCLENLKKQTFRDFKILVIDNHSTDQVDVFLKEQYPEIYFFRNPDNFGFARAHNQGFALSKSEYILILNPDVLLEPNFLEKIIVEADKHPLAYAFGGKVLKVQSGDEEIGEVIKTKIIDSTGLVLRRSHQAADRGEGKEDKGQFDCAEEVFGISGACTLFRRSLLEEIGFFDEKYFAYKEDVDLAWRGQLRGYQAWYAPSAIAYHYRQAGKKKRFNQSPLVSFLSYRNGLFLILQNDFLANILLDFFFIFFDQIFKAFYLLFTKPKVLFKTKISFLKSFFSLMKARRKNLKNHKIKVLAFRKRWLKMKKI